MFEVKIVLLQNEIFHNIDLCVFKTDLENIKR
jgi:hypothetical protein